VKDYHSLLVTKWRIYPPELFVIFFSVITILLYYFYDLTLRSPMTLYLQRVQHGLTLYAIGLLLCILFVRLSDIRKAALNKTTIGWKDSIQAYRLKYLTIERLIFDLRLIHAVCLMFVVFINMKHLIPTINEKLYDNIFFSIEHRIFKEQLASEWLIELLGTNYAMYLSDGYMFFYPYIALLIYIIVFQRDSVLAFKFFTSFILLWFIGILVVYMLPSWGPIYYQPELFELLPSTEVSKLQNSLWEQKLFLDANYYSEQAYFMISGFPSLHLAVAILGSIYLEKVSKVLGVCSWVFAGITSITTLYFGWHYILDNIGSIILVILVMRVTNQILPDD
jgi:hypothetical protein